jgi:hypothetical protein
MLFNLTKIEISTVSGGVCLKTVYSITASTLTSVGTILQGAGQVLHANPNLCSTRTPTNSINPTDVYAPVINTRYQKIIAIGIGALGFVINVAAITMSAYAESEPDCANNNTTTP